MPIYDNVAQSDATSRFNTPTSNLDQRQFQLNQSVQDELERYRQSEIAKLKHIWGEDNYVIRNLEKMSYDDLRNRRDMQSWLQSRQTKISEDTRTDVQREEDAAEFDKLQEWDQRRKVVENGNRFFQNSGIYRWPFLGTLALAGASQNYRQLGMLDRARELGTQGLLSGTFDLATLPFVGSPMFWASIGTSRLGEHYGQKLGERFGSSPSDADDAAFFGGLFGGALPFAARAATGYGLNWAINKYSPKYSSTYNWRNNRFYLQPKPKRLPSYTPSYTPYSTIENMTAEEFVSQMGTGKVKLPDGFTVTKTTTLQQTSPQVRYNAEGQFVGMTLPKPITRTSFQVVPETIQAPPKINTNTITPRSWALQDLPGGSNQIRSLIKGSPLEKQLSKDGTISVKQLQAYIGKNDVPKQDKYLIQQVLDNHISEKHLDYNQLRKEVSDMIPKYNISYADVENNLTYMMYEKYGLDRLGYEIEKDLDIAGNRVYRTPGIKTKTVIFESPGLKGNTKHYKGSQYDPSGHGRMFTTEEEPDVLYVIEDQSDHGQSRYYDIDGNEYTQDLFTRKFPGEDPKIGRAREKEFLSPMQIYMKDSHQRRQLQENLKHAAENGYTKVRYPTSETAAKIEDYTKIQKEVPYSEEERKMFPQNRELVKQKEIELNRNALINSIKIYSKRFPNDLQAQKVFNHIENSFTLNPNKYTFDDLEARWMNDAVEKFENPEVFHAIIDAHTSEADVAFQSFTTQHPYYGEYKTVFDYPPEHQTILKKYDDFPKQYQKLFKGSEIRTFTDSKGNTWYEVDVPQSYLDGTAEIIFKTGGRLIPKAKFSKLFN